MRERGDEKSSTDLILENFNDRIKNKKKLRKNMKFLQTPARDALSKKETCRQFRFDKFMKNVF